MPDDIDGLQLKNTPFRLFDNLIVHAETEFGENYSHKMAILSRTGRIFCSCATIKGTSSIGSMVMLTTGVSMTCMIDS